MNLAAYDSIGGKSSKTKIYTCSNYPYIITREVKKRKYYCYVKRYEPNLGTTLLFLVLLDDKPDDRQVCKTRQDEYGRLKFNLSPAIEIFNLIPNHRYDVELILDTEADDGDVYKVNIS